jgi:hypothetical protein
MKYSLPILATLLVGVASTQVFAQSQKYQPERSGQSQGYGEAQQACEGDVYKLCGQAIPDQDRIVACLRQKFSKVSKPCREAMENYGKHRHRRHKSSIDRGSSAMGSAAKY